MVLQQQQYCSSGKASVTHYFRVFLICLLQRAFYSTHPSIQALTSHHTSLNWFLYLQKSELSLVKLTSCLPKVWFSTWRQEAESCSAEPKPSPSLLQPDIQYCYNNTESIQTPSLLSGRSTQANPKKTPIYSKCFAFYVNRRTSCRSHCYCDGSAKSAVVFQEWKSILCP